MGNLSIYICINAWVDLDSFEPRSQQAIKHTPAFAMKDLWMLIIVIHRDLGTHSLQIAGKETAPRSWREPTLNENTNTHVIKIITHLKLHMWSIGQNIFRKSPSVKTFALYLDNVISISKIWLPILARLLTSEDMREISSDSLAKYDASVWRSMEDMLASAPWSIP